jgi:hypothetical protein
MFFWDFLDFEKSERYFFMFSGPAPGMHFFEILTGRPGPGRPGAVFAPAPTGIGVDFLEKPGILRGKSGPGIN